MQITLWVLQALLAFHTAAGAIWKFSHSAEQTMPSLKAIPQSIWQAMGGIELFCATALILPAFYKPLAFLIPISAIIVAAEMLIFCVLHFSSGDTKLGPAFYWLVVAALCGFVAYGRYALKSV